MQLAVTGLGLERHGAWNGDVSRHRRREERAATSLALRLYRVALNLHRPDEAVVSSALTAI
jgi:hypothetical protein